jgi:hypothetical protein
MNILEGDMRNDFQLKIIEVLAKRVGYKCSNPDCRQLTSGPQADANKAVNVGVAAHITAASPGGSRFDSNLTAGERKSISNGIWLCQKCAKLVDNDPARYTVEKLKNWKRNSEDIAIREIEGVPSANNNSQLSRFAKIENLMPDLLSEMKTDLLNNPLSREFILLKHGWVYSGDEVLVYYFEDHNDLHSKIQILKNLGLVYEIIYNNVERFTISEELADFLCNS